MMGVNSSRRSAATLQIRCPPARLLHPRGKCAPNVLQSIVLLRAAGVQEDFRPFFPKRQTK